MRFRYLYMGLFSVLTLLALFVTSPDEGFIQELPFGAGLIATVTQLLKVVIYVTMLHLSRRALFDYIDLEVYFNKAKESEIGAGLALVAVSLATLALAIIIAVCV